MRKTDIVLSCHGIATKQFKDAIIKHKPALEPILSSKNALFCATMYQNDSNIFAMMTHLRTNAHGTMLGLCKLQRFLFNLIHICSQNVFARAPRQPF